MPDRTPRTNTVLELVVEVVAPAGRFGTAHTAAVLSANVMSAPPCMTPPAVVRSSDHASCPVTSPGVASVIVMPIAAANGINAAWSAGAFMVRSCLAARGARRLPRASSVRRTAGDPVRSADVPIPLDEDRLVGDAAPFEDGAQCDHRAGLTHQVAVA